MPVVLPHQVHPQHRISNRWVKTVELGSQIRLLLAFFAQLLSKHCFPGLFPHFCESIESLELAHSVILDFILDVLNLLVESNYILSKDKNIASLCQECLENCLRVFLPPIHEAERDKRESLLDPLNPSLRPSRCEMVTVGLELNFHKERAVQLPLELYDSISGDIIALVGLFHDLMCQDELHPLVFELTMPLNLLEMRKILPLLLFKEFPAVH